jgi:hypothetical protein
MSFCVKDSFSPAWPRGSGLADEVDARDCLGHRVLHLDARVHLHEVEVLVVVDEELDRAGVLVADLAFTKAHGRSADLLAELFGSRMGEGDSSISFWWRRCTEQSRSPRWTALPCLVGDELDLDVRG